MDLAQSSDLDKLKDFLKSLRFKESVLDELGEIVKKSKYFFSCKKELKDLMLSSSKNFFSLGFPLGEVKKDFIPTPEFIDYLSKKSNKKVVVNKKTEWLFLCGKDVFKMGVIKNHSEKNRGFVFVQNEFGENLGLGKFMRTGNIFIKNIIDKGAYIRKEA
jgi:ribosome biogenesis protein Nip4